MNTVFHWLFQTVTLSVPFWAVGALLIFAGQLLIASAFLKLTKAVRNQNASINVLVTTLGAVLDEFRTITRSIINESRNR